MPDRKGNVVNKNVYDDLQRAIELNIEDARQLVKIFHDSGDRENLERALADLHKWEQKAEWQTVRP